MIEITFGLPFVELGTVDVDDVTLLSLTFVIGFFGTALTPLVAVDDGILFAGFDTARVDDVGAVDLVATDLIEPTLDTAVVVDCTVRVRVVVVVDGTVRARVEVVVDDDDGTVRVRVVFTTGLVVMVAAGTFAAGCVNGGRVVSLTRVPVVDVMPDNGLRAVTVWVVDGFDDNGARDVELDVGTVRVPLTVPAIDFETVVVRVEVATGRFFNKTGLVVVITPLGFAEATLGFGFPVAIVDGLLTVFVVVLAVPIRRAVLEVVVLVLVPTLDALDLVIKVGLAAPILLTVDTTGFRPITLSLAGNGFTSSASIFGISFFDGSSMEVISYVKF